MSTRRPRVTIGLPVRNGERYLARAIDSILAQTFTDFELVVSDNASVDASLEIARSYADRDPRVRVVTNERNLGAAPNYNRLVREARGELFKWAPHDDELSPTYLARCIDAFDVAPASVVVVYTRTCFIDADGHPIGEDHDRMQTRRRRPAQRLADTIRALNMAGAAVGLIRTDALLRTRLIDSFVSSDYVLLAELAMLGDIVEVPEPLMRRRIHEGIHRVANASNRDVLEWFDTSLHGRRVVWTHGRIVTEMLRSVHRLPLATTDRLGCYTTIPTVYFGRQARVVGGRWKARLLARARRRAAS